MLHELCAVLGLLSKWGFEPRCATHTLAMVPVEGIVSGLTPRMGWNSLYVLPYQLHAQRLG